MKTAEFEPMSVQEQLSALHDGQLSAEMAAALVRQSLNDDSLMQQWRSMSVIGMAMGQQQAVAAVSNPLIETKLPSVQASASQSVQMPRAEAANDSVWRWKMVAGFAAVAAVGSLSWGLLGNAGGSDQLAALKQTQNLTAGNGPADNGQAANGTSSTLITVNGQVAGQGAVMIRDPRLDELMAAHKQFGANSALHQSAGSLRSVSIGGARP